MIVALGGLSLGSSPVSAQDSTSTDSTTLQVYGAGSSVVNGTYTCVGDGFGGCERFDGHAKYEKDDGSSITIEWSDFEWVIREEGSGAIGAATDYYSSSVDQFSPPTDPADWNVFAGTRPNPTLSYRLNEKPVATTSAPVPSNVTDSSVILGGAVNANGNQTEVRILFKRPTDDSFVQYIPNPSTVSGTTATNVAASIDNLTASTEYQFFVRGSNQFGVGRSDTLSFTTESPPPEPPTVTAEPATEVTETSAQLNARVFPGNTSTSVRFEYWPTGSPSDSETLFGSISGTTTRDTSVFVEQLSPGETYTYTVTVSNSEGSQDSQQRFFTTEASSLPSTPVIVLDISGSPFTRAERQADVTASLANAGRQDAVQFIGGSGTELLGGTCPDSTNYAELKCRLERFGMTPPAPPKDSSYPALAQEPLFSSASTDPLLPDTTQNPPRLAFVGEQAQLATSFAAGSCPSSVLGVETTVDASGQLGPVASDKTLNRCAFEIGKMALQLAPGADCYSLGTGPASLTSGFRRGQFDLPGYVAANALSALTCQTGSAGYEEAAQVVRTLNDLAGSADGVRGAFEACTPNAPADPTLAQDLHSSECIAAVDPNDKRGPLGAGSGRYITRKDSLPYTVFFENKPDASAPAQDVVIDDTLDPSAFDLSTFRFGPVTFGDTTVAVPADTTSFQADVDLRPERDLTLRVEGTIDTTSGHLQWTFTSRDTTDGLTAIEGFLPPNDNPPEGEGAVSYYADLKSGASSGLGFGNAAEIVFDTNDPIVTPVWSNVLDVHPPTSSVDSLAATQDSIAFEVTWSGSDAESGVQDYTVYVSKDGGTYTTWLADTSATSAVYEGEQGTSYAFYSVATDSVGLTEPDSASAEASTQVSPTAIPVEMTAFEAQVARDGEAVALSWRTASETNNAGFAVQKRTDEQASFERVAFVEGAGTTSDPQAYRLTDTDLAFAADSVTYRLRQVDTDGSAHVSGTVTVHRGVGKARLLGVAPNPVRQQATVRYALPEAQDATLRLYDVLGRRVQTLVDDGTEGRHERTIDVSGLSSGVYFLRFKTEETVQTQKLTVVQ
jgi:hypothetical protein